MDNTTPTTTSMWQDAKSYFTANAGLNTVTGAVAASSPDLVNVISMVSNNVELSTAIKSGNGWAVGAALLVILARFGLYLATKTKAVKLDTTFEVVEKNEVVAPKANVTSPKVKA